MENTIVSYQVKGQVMFYTMPQELDHHVAQTLCKELELLLNAYQIKELILNFEETEFMDSSGIGVVIGRSKMMRFRNGKVYVVNLGKRIDDIFHAAGLYKIVDKKEV